MKVEKISATTRYSQAVDKGAWKVVELGAEVREALLNVLTGDTHLPRRPSCVEKNQR